MGNVVTRLCRLITTADICLVQVYILHEAVLATSHVYMCVPVRPYVDTTFPPAPPGRCAYRRMILLAYSSSFGTSSHAGRLAFISSLANADPSQEVSSF